MQNTSQHATVGSTASAGATPGAGPDETRVPGTATCDFRAGTPSAECSTGPGTTPSARASSPSSAPSSEASVYSQHEDIAPPLLPLRLCGGGGTLRLGGGGNGEESGGEGSGDGGELDEHYNNVTNDDLSAV